ncbi:hypothetical protein BGX29_011721 [Mortierella sp. GBA35]|nr:hypothetical protein BGX29_011721 [Mortierella sp. GBA35]
MDLSPTSTTKPELNQESTVLFSVKTESYEDTRPSPMDKTPSITQTVVPSDDPDGTHRGIYLATSHSSAESEPATVTAPLFDSIPSPEPPSTLLASSESTTCCLVSQSTAASTKSCSPLLQPNTPALATPSHLRKSSDTDTTDVVSSNNDSIDCETRDEESGPMALLDDFDRQQQQTPQETRGSTCNSCGINDTRVYTDNTTNLTTFPIVHSTSVLSSNPGTCSNKKTPRPPMVPRTISLKKRSTLYTHQSMAQSDSQIDRRFPYSTTATSSNTKRQSTSVLSSLSSTFLTIGNTSRSRSQSNANFVSLSATTSASTTPDGYIATKRQSQGSQLSLLQPSPVPHNTLTNKPANPFAIRPFSHFFNSSRQHLMSNPSHSQSTPTLPSHDQPNNIREPFTIRQTGCTCRNKQYPGPCLFHKKLPSLPTTQLDDDDNGGSNKEKKSKRSSVMSIAAVSIRSFMSSVKKPRSRTVSVHSFTQLNSSSAQKSLIYLPSSIAFQPSPLKECPSRHVPIPPSTRRRNIKKPSSFGRAVKRHAGPNAPLTGKSGHSLDYLGFPQTKRQAVYGFEGQPLFSSHHNAQQDRPRAGQLYLYSMSASTPCLVQPTHGAKPTVLNHVVSRPDPVIARIGQASVSAPNLSLHGGAHVSVVNAHAEIIIRPGIAESSASSRRGSIFIASPETGLRSTERVLTLKTTTANGLPTNKTPSSVYNARSYNKENATFFEPFQTQVKSRGGQSSSYVSFHFDLSHLETSETDNEDEDGGDDKDVRAMTTKVTMDRTERSNEEGGESDGEGDGDEDEMENLRCVSTSLPAHPSMSLPNVTLSMTNLLPAHLRTRATLPPPPPPLRSRQHASSQGDFSSDEGEDAFRTLHQHLRRSKRFRPTAASASTPSLSLLSYSQSEQQNPLMRLLGYEKDGSRHRGYQGSPAPAQGGSSSSTASLPAMLSSFLPSSGSTASLPLRSNRRAEPGLVGRGSKPSGTKWSWMWWKGNRSSSDVSKGSSHQQQEEK